MRTEKLKKASLRFLGKLLQDAGYHVRLENDYLRASKNGVPIIVQVKVEVSGNDYQLHLTTFSTTTVEKIYKFKVKWYHALIWANWPVSGYLLDFYDEFIRRH